MNEVELTIFKGTNSVLASISLKWLFVMLVNWHDQDHIYLVCGKTDMRKGIDGLAMVIAENYGLGLEL